MLWTWSQERDQNISKTVLSFFTILFNNLKLLVIPFIMKLIAQINIFKYVKQKHGQSGVRIVGALEQVKWHCPKVNEDIRFIKICKKEDLLPKFVKIRLSIRSGSMKLKWKIACLIMEAELQS